MVHLEFDNIATIDGFSRQIELRAAGSNFYDLTSPLGQRYNISLIRYFISHIRIKGPDGTYFEDITNRDGRGYYLIDENEDASLSVELQGVPAGIYEEVSFTVGFDRQGLDEDALGGPLDPRVNEMYRNWEKGFAFFALEGQAIPSKGSAEGILVSSDVPHGFVFHAGGWEDAHGHSLEQQIRPLQFHFDNAVSVASDRNPEIHITFDLSVLLGGAEAIDFQTTNFVVEPGHPSFELERVLSAFSLDHVHQ